MSVAVCRSVSPSFQLEKEGFVGSMLLPNRPLDSLPTDFSASNSWSPSAEQHRTSNSPEEVIKKEVEVEVEVEVEKERPGKFDIWSSIQSQKGKATVDLPSAPYVHPLVRRSSSLLSQKSLEICTESLGSETGSDDFSSDDMDNYSLFSSKTHGEEVEEKEDREEIEVEPQQQEQAVEKFARFGEGSVLHGIRKELASVNYHCSISRRSPPRSFPPPLPSISRRDGPCLQMRPHRRDGRLVVEAVPVPSQNYLHAERQGGRLLLSFIDTTFHAQELPQKETRQQVEEKVSNDEEEFEEEEVAEDEEEEEEVEVVDRGTMVEVKVSTQPQQQSGAAAMKVHRSSIVINKFVGGTPLISNHNQWIEETLLSLPNLHSHMGRLSPTTTTAAAAAVAASSLSSASSTDGCDPPSDNKMLFTSKTRNREELLRNMRRCSQLRKPLFIWEPCCIATSS